MVSRKILVVDDEPDLGEILCINLVAAGLQAESVLSAEAALDKIQEGGAYDLLLLDVMLPGMSGFELAKRLKNDEQTARLPIIFLTAKDAEDDTLRGFGIGADDYVTKPFSVREVVARVKAVINRIYPVSDEELLRYEGLQVDLVKKEVTIDGEYVGLTRTEYDLLKLMFSHQGVVFSRQQLLDMVWPSDVIVTFRTIDVNITRLRKKMGRYASCIVTRQGFGYCFSV